jgi:nitrate reductase gamma subunit
VAAVQVWILYRNLRGTPNVVAALRAKNAGRSAFQALKEAVLQGRFSECADDRLRRLAHLGVSWGFMGMLLATMIIGAVDFGWLPWPRWVSLAVGSVSGVACALGLGYYLSLRLAKRTAVGKYSHPSDWAFLLLLALSVLSGFAIVAFRFLGLPAAAYATSAFHLVVVFDLLVTFPFSKFAHVVYRPAALFLAGLK